MDQLRSERLPQERTGERDAESGGDRLRQDPRRGQDRLLRGGLRLPELEGIPGGEPGDVPEEVQGHQRIGSWGDCRSAGLLQEARGEWTRGVRLGPRHQMEQHRGQKPEGRKVQRPDEDDRHEPGAGLGGRLRGCFGLRPVLPDLPREPGVRTHEGERLREVRGDAR